MNNRKVEVIAYETKLKQELFLQNTNQSSYMTYGLKDKQDNTIM